MTTLAGNKETVRFLLDGEVHQITDVPPTTTLLEYLRDELHRCGTKEGCAEGDCGACTVVLADFVDGGIRYRATNSCIQFLPTIDGKALFTVESLTALAEGDLHPVQQAMVDCHGSQCGFCTPGFVMSLFALYQSNHEPAIDDIRYTLAGNLCRCTGYRPILAAAKKMYELKSVAGVDENRLKAQLDAIRVSGTKEISEGGYRYTAPATVDELGECLMARPEATILAGGTDVGLWVTKQHQTLHDIIYIGNVAELTHIEQSDEHIEFGAAVSLTDAFSVLLKEYPDLYEIVRRFASPPICNSGTLCGNVANGSPIGDSMPALICLNTEVILRRGSETRTVPLGEFYLGYQRKNLRSGEFVACIRVPKASSELKLRSYKISKRFDQDISAVCAAFAIELDGDRIRSSRVCFGVMAPVPKRAAACEDALEGSVLGPESVTNAVRCLSKDFAPISDCRATAEYRADVAGNLLRRFYLDVSDTAAKTCVWDLAV